MTKKQLQKEWGKIISEVHNKPTIKTPYPEKVVFVRELLLFAETILQKIEYGQQTHFNEKLYRLIMKKYAERKLCLKI